MKKEKKEEKNGIIFDLKRGRIGLFPRSMYIMFTTQHMYTYTHALYNKI
jgi:hypothetical protein